MDFNGYRDGAMLCLFVHQSVPQSNILLIIHRKYRIRRTEWCLGESFIINRIIGICYHYHSLPKH